MYKKLTIWNNYKN